ncbi:MAG TPA: ElyC/SanA/YdcF family protein, partial [Blastocatellia bacterium]
FQLKPRISSARRLKLAILLVTAAVLSFGVASNSYVVRSVRPRVFDDADSLPVNDVGLVLGSSPKIAGGVNPHFKARIEAAAYLFRIGKVKHLLLSGDNHTQGYNEPADMRISLLALGIPDEAMTLDYAGFRTLDSVARAREVFGLTKATIITEEFHIYRALFLASHFGLDAVAYRLPDVPFKSDPGPQVRELGARVKAVLDVFVLDRGPRFTGPRVDIKV